MSGLFLTLFMAMSLFAQENPDRESTEKIEQAEQKILSDFGALQSEDLKDVGFSMFSAYQHLDPKRWVPTDLLQKAIRFFEANKKNFKNQRYISIVDFAPRSNEHRFYIINLQTGAVERYRTTHGSGSDKNRDGYAESFSNTPGSHQSSLGYVRTAEVYYGSFGRSLRLDGLSTTNSKIRSRAIVFHGWKPVVEANQIQAMSWGCITSDLRFRDRIIDQLKDGSLMYVAVSQE